MTILVIIKLFIGQEHKMMAATDLFPIFEKYGPIQDVVVIRDKHSSQFRGCAFVTYLSNERSDRCESELHSQLTFLGGTLPVQIRPVEKKEGQCL